MQNPHGSFIWYELITTDPAAAEDFYGKLFGWAANPVGDPSLGYKAFSLAEKGIAGLLPAPQGEDGCALMRPAWLGYVGVDDVDAMVAAFVEGGGKVLMPASDLPNIGRIAMVEDPQGLPLYLMRGAIDAPSESFAQMRLGHAHWNELTTDDPVAALDFYGEHFGWTRGTTVPMGEMGDYQLFRCGSEDIGGAMATPPGAEKSWTVYFGAADIDEAATLVWESGGAILHGPHEVPGGAFVFIARDPQGAVFGVTGNRGEVAPCNRP